MSEKLTKTASFWRKLSGSGATYSTTPPPRQIRSLPVDSNTGDDESAPPGLWLLASALQTAHGTQAADVLAAIKDLAWPKPDPQLVDNEGNPAWTSRVSELDTDAVANQLAASEPAEAADTQTTLKDDRLRTLALLDSPLQSLLDQATELIETTTDEDQRKAIQLRITVFLPKYWSEPERAQAVRFIDQSANSAKIKNRWLVNAVAAHYDEENHAPALFDQLALALRRERRQVLWIVLAADSALSSSRIATLDTAGRLYKSGRRDSVMAGEGAAGALITGTRAPQSWTHAPAMRLHWALGRRDSPADALAQPSTSTLDTLCATVLRAAQREPADLCAIVNDADHRKSRTAEINRWATQAFPETVTAEQCFSTGTSSGHLEAAAAELYALAIAHHLAQEQQQPALAVSVGDAITRSALLVAPDTPANIPAPKAQS